MMAIIMSMITTSCEKENSFLNPEGELSSITFNVATPEIATRAYSDGKTATVLQYAVYDAAGNELESFTRSLAKENADAINGTKNIELQLTTGNTYSVIFWAAAPGAPYTVDLTNKTMTVDYTAAVCNDENRDAFFAHQTFEVKGSQTVNVELKRPFAQLNIGTADYTAAANAGYTPTKSSVTVKKIYSELDLETGAVSTPAEVTFAEKEFNKSETFPVDGGYEYLAMNYILVDAAKETVDIEFTYTDGSNPKVRKVGSVPVQRNYRTNIYGNLLTSEVDIKVEIKYAYDGAHNLNNVVVDGISYPDFAEAVDKAIALNKPVEFIQNIKIDADETIVVPAGNTLTLNLNGYTLSGVTDDADKNDDGKISSADNEVMFDVRGTMNVNNGIVTISHVKDSDYANFKWAASGEIFYVAENGTLNINNSTLENFGGISMAYVIDMVNAKNDLTVNIDNSIIKSSYIPVRVFNNGSGMNNVNITNTTLQGTSRAFWVHIYSNKDNNNKGVKDATLNINIYNPTCNNIFIADNEDRIIEYGFDDVINFRADGTKIYKMTPIIDSDGNELEGIYIIEETAESVTYGVVNARGLAEINNLSHVLLPTKSSEFKEEHFKLLADINLTDEYFAPIGFNPETGESQEFTGTFDGQGYSIKGLRQSTLDGKYTQSVGLFAKVKDATIKNLVLEDFVTAKYGAEAGAVASIASGNCTFEKITVKNGSIVSYNNDTAPIIGWANVGNFKLKDITIASDVTIYSLWDSYDTTLGGLIGTLKSPSTVDIENANVSCVLNAFNDVAANYQWYAYRRTGMIIGNMSETMTDASGRTTPDPKTANVTCKNVIVTYGDWMNYHYCEFEANGKPSYAKEGEWKFSRVEGQEWGRESYIDTDNCQHDTDETHNICLPVDQLFGGGQGVYGLREYEGVTVNYPASYRREVSSAAGLSEALGKGLSVVLDADIDFGTTQLAITGANQVVDLGGHTLKTQMSYGGIALKNGASIVNGTIEHTSTVAAIKAFNVGTIENVTIKATCGTADKTITAIAVQQGGHVGTIKNVTIEGVSQGIEVGYQATVDLIESVTVEEHTNGTANGIGLVINGGKVGKAKNCTFKGDAYGVTMHLKGVFNVGLELENCKVEGATASIYAWDEKGISNTSGSLNLTYDSATTLTGPFVWDFEEECQSVVTLSRPQ